MRPWKFLLPLLASTLCFAAQPDRITGAIDSSQMVDVRGNVHGLAQARFDLGRTDGGQQLHGITLVFHPSAAQQNALNTLLAEQQDRSFPNYHKWLSPAQFADRFGMTKDDISRVVTWLESKGFTVTSVANSRNQISFDGTVGQVESTFATEIHNYLVDGVIHFANATNPSVPAALAGSVLAIGYLHNFSPKPRAITRRISSSDGADPHFTSYVSGNHFLSPGDFATIYNVGPLYTAGFNGTGQSIAIIGQSTVSATDLSNFRSAAGLAAKTPQYVLYPSTSIATRCAGDEGESDLDLEWSNGVASNANVIFVYAGLGPGDTCASRNNSVWNALQDAVDTNIAPVISTSYGFCESGLGLSFTDTVQGWAQQANAQGQTIMAASGDDGAADCDFQVTSATQGLAVDVPAAIPEVTGMGGTEFFGDAAGVVSGGNAAGDPPYWSGTTGGVDTISSALEYIPEEAWNDTTFNLTQTDGTIGASGGGASIYFTKPTWQTGTGVPNDGKRDVPDLALTTSPDHDGYLFCSEDGPNGTIQSSCTVGFRDGAGGNLAVVGGTSAAAPTFSAILTLIEQDLGSAGFGNINPSLYEFAAGTSPFHDITTGNNIVPCTEGTTGCPTTAPFQYGFSAGTGYDQVTGLGSVNAEALATAWGASRTASSITITSVSSANVYSGTPVTFTVAVTPSTGVGAVSFSSVNGGVTTVLGSVSLNTPYPQSQSGTATFSTSTIPAGSNSITATYQGDASNQASTSSQTNVTVTVPFAISASPAIFSVSAGQTATSTITLTPASGFTGSVNFSPSSCNGLPSGAACSFNQPSVSLSGVPSSPSTVTLTITTAPNMAPVTPTITVTGTASGTSTASETTSVSLTIGATTETFNLAPTGGTATYSVTAGQVASVGITVTGTNGFIVGSSNTTALPLTYACSGIPAGAQIMCTFSPGNGQSISQTAVTMSLATTAPTAQLRSPFGRGSRIFYALLLPGMFGIVFAGRSRTRAARLLSLIVVLSLSTLWLGACSGSSGSGQKNAGTPAGNYTVTVTATTGGAVPLINTGTPFTITLTVTN
jgi:pro-kumamolisin-like protein/Big-like domain-containing protein